MGAVWNNLVDDAVYSGTLTSSLTITNVTLAMSTNNYRCVITATCGAPVNSNAAVLTVVPAINNVISADQTVCSGSTTPAPLTGTTGGTYLWQMSTVSSTTGFVTATGTNNGSGYAPAAISQTTYYRRNVNNGTCSNTSNVVTVTLNTTPIVITIPPVAQTVCTGATAVYTVSATGTLAYDYLIPFQLQETIYSWVKQFHKTNWGNNSWQTYVQLNDNASPTSVNNKLKNVVISHFTDENTLKHIKPEVFIHPDGEMEIIRRF
ncbi:MAG: hypothetical protein WDM78_20175 [Puia sp.]